MNYLTTLLTLATLLGTQAATSSLVGGVRVSTDTTGTNTIAASVVITNLNGGASRTALMARDVQVTNAVKVLSLTGNRVVGIGTDKALTNTAVSIATLEALSTAGTNNWINSSTTNSTLAGTAYPWGVEATNHVNVGASGEAGVILFTSTNGTYTASISLLANGTLVVTNNGVLVATVALVSGLDGSTNKFLSAAGTYLPVSGANIWTNSAGTIEAMQPIANEADGVTPYNLDTSLAHTSGTLIDVRNNGTLLSSFDYLGGLHIDNQSGFVPTITVADTVGIASLQSVELQLTPSGTLRTDLLPFAGDGMRAYLFDTGIAHTSGNLVEVKNDGTNKVIVDYTGRITLASTTNHITFGATNSAPSSSVSPTKWISVQVQGEAAVYRLPLYE